MSPRQLSKNHPRILWKGGDVAVVYKPPQWICETQERRPSPWSTHDDIPNFARTRMMHWWLQLEFPQNDLFKETKLGYGLCHRLDRETSGALLVALSPEALFRMQGYVRAHKVHKTYLCLARGSPEAGTVQHPLQVRGNAKRQTLPHPEGKAATTEVRPLVALTISDRSFCHSLTQAYTLCRCEIYEGRTHQIRSHMAFVLNTPLAADDLYPRKVSEHEDHCFCNRLFLHAYALAFPYGDLETYVCVVCPLAPDLVKALRHLEVARPEKLPLSAEIGCDWRSLSTNGFLKPSDAAVVFAEDHASLSRLGLFDWKLDRVRSAQGVRRDAGDLQLSGAYGLRTTAPPLPFDRFFLRSKHAEASPSRNRSPARPHRSESPPVKKLKFSFLDR